MKGNNYFLLSLLLSFACMPMYARLKTHNATQRRSASEVPSHIKKVRGQKNHQGDCARQFKICEVPVVIDQPGKWFVCEDLCYDGTGTAILITANNVTLDFLNHDLVLSASATGIEAQNVRELVIKNDLISTPTVSEQSASTAIYLTGCEKVRLENIFTANTFEGLLLDNNCVDITVHNCHFKNHTGGSTGNGSAVDDNGSSSLSFDQCIFEGTTGAGVIPALMTFFASSTNVRFSSSQFSNADIGIGFGGSGLLVEDCQFFGSQSNNFSLIQLGFFGAPTSPNQPATDVTIRNSTLISAVPDNLGLDGLAAGIGSGLIVENVVIDTQGRGTPAVPVVGGLHLGNSLNPSPFNDVIVSKTIIRNQNDNGLVSESGSSGLLVTNSTISDALVAGVHFFDTQASTITESLINLNNEGIVLEKVATGSIGNSIVYNTITTNTVDGVNIKAGNTFNVVVNNVINNNGTAIINKGGATNKTTPNF